MKKLLLTLCFCLIVTNVNAKNPSKNVDTFYHRCQNADETKNWVVSGYCAGFVAGLINERFNTRLYILKNISFTCSPTPGEVYDRFLVLYRRNQFEIGSSTGDAIRKAFLSLCPIITREQWEREYKRYIKQ